ncbi:MAG: hypothetical protein QF645_09790, partial [Planctomycetota bacterium]|nr:hypothetical protein [Planctomycetota bacterium]
MDPLQDLFGKEVSLDEIPHRLRRIVEDEAPTIVGAMLQTCADESEQECAHAFERGIARRLLPALKFGEFSPFRLATLGSHYEWSSIRIAENHFAVDSGPDHFKVMIVKMNSHVSKDGDLHYGEALRYDHLSTYCGGLKAVRSGLQEPFAKSLREDFGSEEVDRLHFIEMDMEEPYRPLAAALVNARIQARKAVLDLQDFAPSTPTVFLVLPCVTLNLPQRDTEVLCGYYRIDSRKKSPDLYRGLGDNPSLYQIGHDRNQLVVTEKKGFEDRPARDHRRMAQKGWVDAIPFPPEKL